MVWQMRQKCRFFWLHPPPTSLEAYSLLYLYLYSSVDIPTFQRTRFSKHSILPFFDPNKSNQTFRRQKKCDLKKKLTLLTNGGVLL
jgi:hypothetical protein